MIKESDKNFILAGNHMLLNRLYNERNTLAQEKSDLWQSYMSLKSHLNVIKKAFDAKNNSAVDAFIIQIDGILEEHP